MKRCVVVVVAVGVASLIGCAGAKPRAAGTATTQPSGAVVRAGDFDRLWAATDDVARDLHFDPSRQDRRLGIYQTAPMVSSQWFEPWRQDLRTAADTVESSLNTMRRTLTVKLDRDESGRFVATPTVLVERYALAERRITSSAGYRSVFRSRARGYSAAQTDAGEAVRDSYWYPVGNDPALERHVARQIESRLGS